MECILNILKIVNNDYSELMLLIVALFTFYLGYREFIAKRRPYIFPELVFEEKDNNWYFSFILKNAGNYPAQVKVNEAQLIIGDETYPTVFNSEMLVPIGDANKVLPIGHINENGRNKIKTNQYHSNRAEIKFDISSKPIGEKNYRFKTVMNYEISVNNKLPQVNIISEKFL